MKKSIRKKLPPRGTPCLILPVFRTEEIRAVFYDSYSDLFGNTYLYFFMDEKGTIFELSQVLSWNTVK